LLEAGMMRHLPARVILGVVIGGSGGFEIEYRCGWVGVFVGHRKVLTRRTTEKMHGEGTEKEIIRSLLSLCEFSDIGTASRHHELRAFSVVLRGAPC